MQTARNRYFPRKSWELCTAYSKGGGRGSGGLNSKIRPCVEELFLAYLLEQAQEVSQVGRRMSDVCWSLNYSAKLWQWTNFELNLVWNLTSCKLDLGASY